MQGKVIGNIIKLVQQYKKPVIIMAGNCTLNEAELDVLQVHSLKTINEIANNFEDAIKNTAIYLEKMAANIILEKP